jgi:signal transduction histidine kinase
MNTTKILILEHDSININALENQLDQTLKNYSTCIVQTEKEYQEALESFAPNIILSDYTIPTFDWNAAFQLKQKIAPAIPFILVSGPDDGEEALELIKSGVTDYVFRGKPGSLVPKIVRALNEAELREAKRKEQLVLQRNIADLRTIFDNTEVGFVFLNPDLKVLAYNQISNIWAATIFGHELQADAKFTDLLLPDRLADFSIFATELMSGKSITHEASYPKNDGSPMWFTINGKPVMEKDMLLGICIAITNITDRKLAEENILNRKEELEVLVKERTVELTDANIALEAFAYSVSHDLRAPVRSLIGFSEIIKNEYGHQFSPDLKELFNYIESSGKRMNNIINQLLILSKNGKESLNIEEVNITALFAEVWTNLQKETAYCATIELPKMPFIQADSSMLQQVIVNLLSNALKYSSKEKRPHIQVACEQTDGKIILSVKDNGAGFDMKHYGRLFGAFQRLHSTSEFEGTGIGLSLIKRIIERHGGEVWAEAKVTEGATFYCSLPYEKAARSFKLHKHAA